ncbi:MAG: glycosyltransferase family 2 protein [Christensenellales bacterium]
MPELSIIVPVYKVEKYLPRCIDSILAQTFGDFELILIDDGSPDGCGRICDEYARKDKRIVVIHQKNMGVSAARNAGLDIARGRYIGFVDSDDWIEPQMYEAMMDAIRENGADMAVCGVRYADEDGKFTRADMLSEGVYSRDGLLEDVFAMPNRLGGGCCNKVFDASKIASVRFKVGMTIAEDALYLFDCFMRIDGAVKIGDALYNVYERCGSATRTDSMICVNETIEGRLSMLRHTRKYMPSMEARAADKFLDECLRCAPQIRSIGMDTHKPYRSRILRIKWKMLKEIVRSAFKRTLPRAKLHGYIYEWMKL